MGSELTIGQRLRAWRRYRGLTLDRLVQKAEALRRQEGQTLPRFHVSELSRIEHGKRGIRAESLYLLVKALGLSMAEFDGEPPAEAAAASG